MTGIVAYGAYLPRLRLQRDAIHRANKWFAPQLAGLAKGARAIANWDEDVITMAVEAARDCLGRSDRSEVASVVLASTTAPYLDRQNAGVVKEALNLPDAVSTMDVGGSQKAATGALLQGLNALAPNGRRTLLIAAEKHRSRPGSEGEMTDGDGAAAILLGTEDVIARLVGAHSVSIDFVDHFRAAGAAFDYHWESRWVREEGYVGIAGRAVRDALTIWGVPASDITHFIAPIAARGAAGALGKAVGVPPGAVRDTLATEIGHTGAAHPLVMLADVLDVVQPGDHILVLGFGQGADVALFQATGALASARERSKSVTGWKTRAKAETNYMKYLAFNGHLQMDAGMRAEFDQKQPLAALYRNRRTVFGLVGSRCSKTGVIQFPRSEISVASDDVSVGTQQDYPLADIPARILTYTADNLGYSPDPPGCYGMVEFEGGGRMVCEFTDIDPADIEVGMNMRMMFRIKANDDRRQFSKYFWKAVPTVEEA